MAGRGRPGLALPRLVYCSSTLRPRDPVCKRQMVFLTSLLPSGSTAVIHGSKLSRLLRVRKEDRRSFGSVVLEMSDERAWMSDRSSLFEYKLCSGKPQACSESLTAQVEAAWPALEAKKLIMPAITPVAKIKPLNPEAKILCGTMSSLVVQKRVTI